MHCRPAAAGRVATRKEPKTSEKRKPGSVGKSTLPGVEVGSEESGSPVGKSL